MLRFLCLGDWAEDAVSTTWTASTRRREPAVEAAIETAWAAASARLGEKLFDGPMCRVEAWSADGERLGLRLSRSSYKPFLGTNMANPHFAREYGQDVMANPLGVSPILLTDDGWLLLGRRNDSVAYYPGRIHPFAGCLEPADGDVGGGPNLFAALRRELGEELNLAAAELAEVRCVGLVQDERLLQCEAIFFVQLAMRRAAVEQLLDEQEHRSVFPIPAIAPAIEPILQLRGQLPGELAMTPVAVASLLLWGRRALGQAWFERHVAMVGSIG